MSLQASLLGSLQFTMNGNPSSSSVKKEKKTEQFKARNVPNNKNNVFKCLINENKLNSNKRQLG